EDLRLQLGLIATAFEIHLHDFIALEGPPRLMGRHLFHLLVETVQTRKFTGKGTTALDLQCIEQVGQPDGTFGVVALAVSYRVGDDPDALENTLIAGR